MFIKLKRSPTDILFSKVIRTRDKWTCQRCHLPCEYNKGYLDCSHVFSRAKKSVRWDTDNAFAICKKCHDYFTKNDNENKDFARKRLGQSKYDLLCLRASTPQKVDEGWIAVGLKQLLKDLEAQEPIIYGAH